MGAGRKIFGHAAVAAFLLFSCALPEAVSGDERKVAPMRKIIKTDDEWRKILTPEQYRVTRQGGTECAFTGKFWDFKGRGVFKCVCCGSPLFRTSDKFESGTGWPSFTEPFSKDSLAFLADKSLGMTRVEIRCAVCDAHLGHVFGDGPPPGGKRHCINSAALVFSDSKDWSKAAFAAGCFWGVEEFFRRLPGVMDTSVGYMGGSTKNPTYKEVCTDKTGHAETVLVEYDPAVIKYGELLGKFFELHDPTQLNRQGPDVGTQYRSAVFFYDDAQKKEAEAFVAALSKSGRFKKPVVTETRPAGEFYRAEEYHQRYLEKRGGPSCHR